jgi:hypothetical protein
MGFSEWLNQAVSDVGNWWKQTAAPAINKGLDWVNENVGKPLAQTAGGAVEGMFGKDAGDAVRNLPGSVQKIYHGDWKGGLGDLGRSAAKAAPAVIGGLLGGPEGAALGGKFSSGIQNLMGKRGATQQLRSVSKRVRAM